MDKQIPGIHHVTAIASDPQQNVDFYTNILGLRLVKLTVNFDDPGTYHLYYGDGIGHPGTILTFFPWPDARRGRRGTGQVAVTSFAVPEGTLDYWEARLKSHDITVGQRQHRFEEEVLAFMDPDWMQLELVAHSGAEMHSLWEGGPVPTEYAIRGFQGVTLWERDPEPTAALLTGTLGFHPVAEDGSRFRYRAASQGPGAFVDLLHLPQGEWGLSGAGTVHHVAWRTPNDAEQLAWRQELSELGLRTTPVMDRQYFRSIYFREPGGVLFEIATDPPGFMRDESLAELGTRLRLPPWLEPKRAAVESALPELVLPVQGSHGPTT
ncbi:MAG TPA: ring-cleaving dioxygenase [Anaerolineae bacterium]|nr:ring-cleaving dioxygenase [Anaerolineae bacterium]